ncbi:hypothetical protein FOA52_000312 [Chlamydomonas sp. UWO 241]|nr:hypothetical protein FOA52_000312 [Chlamydomonas sp. UWO 241]
MMASGREGTLVLLLALLGATVVQGRVLLAVARSEQGMSMHNGGGSRKMVMGTRCHLEVELVGDSKYNPCQDLEIISEAIEVIYAFAVGLEPDEVAVNRVGCNTDGINVAIGFGSHVNNSTLTAIANGGPPRMMAATLAPFGLALKSTTVLYDVRRLMGSVEGSLADMLQLSTSERKVEQAYGGHQAPEQDASIAFDLVRADGTSVSPDELLCLGETYTLSVTFPQPRQYLVTASAGVMGSRLRSDRLACANRFLATVFPVTLAKSMLTLPCAGGLPDGTLEIAVTSATGAFDAYRQATATFGVDAECGVAACTAGTPSPPSQPPPPPPSPSPSPSPPAATQTAVQAPTQSPGCEPSSLGYACSFKPTTTTTAHWSLGTPMPDNHCTAAPAGSSGVDDAGNSHDGHGEDMPGVLHMAFEAHTSGYVGLGFTTTHKMVRSDVVFGVVRGDGTSVIDVWHTTGYYSMNKNNAIEPAWTTFKAVRQTRDADDLPVTTICFSRPLVAPSAFVSSQLSETQELKLIYAAAGNGVTEFGFPHHTKGSLQVDLLTGSTEPVSTFDREAMMRTHASLMLAAWIGLIPVAVIAARHRWVFGEAKFRDVHVWFHIHRGLNLIGVLIFVIGFSYAWSYLPGSGEGNPVGGAAGRAHMVIGTMVMVLVALQVLLGIMRPPAAASGRPQWNFLHHFVGRLSLPLAWVTLSLGVYMSHTSSVYLIPLGTWLIPILVMGVLLLVTTLVLEVLRSRYKVDEREPGAGAVPLSYRAGGTSFSDAPGERGGSSNPLASYGPGAGGAGGGRAQQEMSSAPWGARV